MKLLSCIYEVQLVLGVKKMKISYADSNNVEDKIG